ncbi:MAG: competence protein ComEC [Paraglaciecola sp.]|jgi:competence protein ComEC
MDGKLFSFIVASFSVLYWPILPPLHFLYIVLLASILCLRFTYGSYLVAAMLGIVWMASVGHWQRNLQLPMSQIASPISVIGTIGSLVHKQKQVRFNLEVEEIEHRLLQRSRTLRLSWGQPDWPLKQGQRVQMFVKLKPPNGLANDGGFHYQKWLFSEGIVATGYVKNSSLNLLLSADQTARQTILDRLIASKTEQVAWIAALGLGYRGLLQTEDWHLVQVTGIAHLIAISGLHLALVASVSYALFSGLLVRFVGVIVPSHKINIHKLGLLSVIGSTMAYSGLAGFGLPTLRAWIMLVVIAFLVLTKQNWSLRRLFLFCLMIFLVLFPLSIFGLSFWLSFSAVIIISFIFWCWPQRKQGFSIKAVFLPLLRIQLGLSILMLPLVASQFSYISLVSPWVNLIAVPLVTFVLVPICLAGVILLLMNSELAFVLFDWASIIIEFALVQLSKLVAYEWAAIDIPAIPAYVWLITACALWLFLLPRFIIKKMLVTVLLLPLISHFIKSDETTWKAEVLDVGQGVAVLLIKNHRAILYDVGAAYPSGFNMADAVILPLLRARGITQLDSVFISHYDNDHSGSLPQLQSGIKILETINTANLCRIGWNKRWQGLHIEALWPDEPTRYSSNNGSCVLIISDGLHSLLLPGDIDSSVEKRLVALHGNKLKADILLAPHHGSNTSSSDIFINQVRPEYVVFSQGYMNRWGFPKEQVLERYEGVPNLLLTSEEGQVTFRFDSNSDVPFRIQTFRQHTFPYWYANYQQ